MFKAPVTALALFMLTAAGNDTVYEFLTHCPSDDLGPCFNLIEQHLDRLKATGQGKAFCLPGGFGAGMLKGDSFSVSILEHVRVELSAARFGGAERPVDEVMSEILGRVYPCH